jgi:hypothetical protein
VIQSFTAKGSSDACFSKEEGDEKNIPAGRGVAAVDRLSFRDGNRSEVDRRLGQLQ